LQEQARGQGPEDREQRTEDRGDKAGKQEITGTQEGGEDGGRRTEDGGTKQESRK
jgi:hypothetical protein